MVIGLSTPFGDQGAISAVVDKGSLGETALAEDDLVSVPSQLLRAPLATMSPTARAPILIAPPSGENLRALDRKLVNTSRMNSASAHHEWKML